MIDKQIIIDDVDVSKCKYYKEYSNPNEDGDEYNDICECSITESAFCFDECNSNCYFKNWQRKEQECEELKDKLNCCFCNPNIELNDIEKLQKCLEITECFRRQLDQLKKENETYKSSIVANLDKNISKRYRELLEENDQLKQTLAEIKKIAEECIKINDYTYNPSIQVTARAILSKEILQKISESEVK